MLLLFTDTHFDDNPDNEYRWDVFDGIHHLLSERPVTHVYHLGDICDRKDRFTGAFVNRLLTKMREVGERTPLTVLRGNHDNPLNGPAYFTFVNGLLPGVDYVTEPQVRGKLALLPFSPDPKKDWEDIPFRNLLAAFMHITVTGAIAENGREMVGQDPSVLPRALKLYSGDIHNPQTLRNLTYVGCPHPVKFGDAFPCRMLLLDEVDFSIVGEVELTPPRKRVLTLTSLQDLETVEVTSGDQVRIRFDLDPTQIEDWGAIEARLEAWASEVGVAVAGIEGIVAGRTSQSEVDPETTPEALLKQFAQEEGISKGLLEVGLALLEE